MGDVRVSDKISNIQNGLGGLVEPILVLGACLKDEEIFGCLCIDSEKKEGD